MVRWMLVVEAMETPWYKNNLVILCLKWMANGSHYLKETPHLFQNLSSREWVLYSFKRKLWMTGLFM